MFRKSSNTFLTLLLVLAVIVAFTSCGKLKVSNLRANYYFNRANALFSEQDYRDAIEEYERALIYNPNLVEAFRFLGECYKNLYKPGVETPENQEKKDRALENLRKAYEINPSNKEIIYSLGDMYDRLRDFEEAEKMYLKMEQYKKGEAFVRAIADARGRSALSRLWDGPASLPRDGEIAEHVVDH